MDEESRENEKRMEQPCRTQWNNSIAFKSSIIYLSWFDKMDRQMDDKNKFFVIEKV